MYRFKNNTLFPCKKAFSLMEIVVAVALLGMVISIVCGVFVHGLHAIKKGKYRAGAIHVANQKFAELNNLDFGDPNGIPVVELKVPPPDGYIEGFASYVAHRTGDIPWNTLIGVSDFEVTGVQDMGWVDYNFHIKIEGYDINLKKIVVEVTWKEPDGNRKLELSRLMTKRI